MGLAVVKGRGMEAQKHMMAVNGWDEDEALTCILSAFKQYHDRSQHEWELDLTWLEEYRYE